MIKTLLEKTDFSKEEIINKIRFSEPLNLTGAAREKFMNKEKLLEMFESMSIIIVQSLEEKEQTEDQLRDRII